MVKVTQKEFDQLLCHDCAVPLKITMCHTCCECTKCFKGPCEGKYRWQVEVNKNVWIVYGSMSIFAPRHTNDR